MTAPARRCPVTWVHDVTPCDPDELEPLLGFLAAGGAATDADLAFTRGTVTADGRLDLCKQALGPQGVARVLDALSASHHVRHILLGTDALGDEGAAAVAAHIERGGRLETVYLGCNAIADAGISRLADALHDDQTVRALWLKRNLVRPSGARALAAMLQHNTHLEVLDLVNSELGDEGIAAIAEALPHNRTLRHLYLGGNGLSTEGAAHLADALARNTGLRGLALAMSPLGDEGAAHIARALAAHPGLEQLGVASCSIGPAGAAHLADAARQSASLRHLDLGRAIAAAALGEAPNALGDEGAEVFARALAADPPLQTLDLRHNGVTGRGTLALERGLATNHHLVALTLGAFTPRKARRRIQQRLAINRARLDAAAPAPDATPPHIQAIRSVYRTAPLPFDPDSAHTEPSAP